MGAQHMMGQFGHHVHHQHHAQFQHHHQYQLGDMGLAPPPHAPRQPTAWDRKFQLLQQYVREFGNTRVPENLDTARYPRLGVRALVGCLRWCSLDWSVGLKAA